MRKFSFLFSFLFFAFSFGQTVNLYNPADNTPYAAQEYFCPSENFVLKADAVATATGDYTETKDLPSNYPLSSGGTQISFPATGANKFSNSFPIGFTFSFYGKNYTRVVAGSNGRLVFTNDPVLENLNDVATYTDRTFSGITGYNSYEILPSPAYNRVYKEAPTQELPLAQIFFGYTDLIPRSQNSSVTYSYKNVTVGTHTALLVSYQNMIRSNGTGGFSSVGYNSNVLLIDDGRVIIYVSNKTEDTYNAIVALQNETGLKAKIPSHSNNAYNYNNGPWKSEGVVHVFTPSQNLVPQFKWFRNGLLLPGQVGNSFDTSSLVPSLADGDVLQVEVIYTDPDTGLPIGQPETDEVLFKELPQPVITANSSGGCVTGVPLSVPADAAVKFEWFRVGNPAVLGTGPTYFASQTGDYFVRATRLKAPLCAQTSVPVAVDLNSTIPAFNEGNTPLYYCENSGIVSKEINLYDYYPANPAQYSLKFFLGATEITDPANFTIPPNSSLTIRIEVKDPVSNCELNHSFTLRYDALPVSSQNIPQRFCYGQTSLDASDYLLSVAGPDISTFTYQYSTDGVNFGSDPVFNPAVHPKIWVKVLPKNPPAGSCESVFSLLFTEDAKVIANAPTTQLPPQCASATETFDLASLIPEINADPDVTVTFHRSFADAQSGNAPVNYNFRSGLGYTHLFIRVVDNATGCASPDYPEITLLVYAKPTLVAATITQKNCAGNTVFDLTKTASQLTNAAPPVTVTLDYFAPDGTPLSAADISAYDEAVYGSNPFIRVSYNPTCSDVVTFALGYHPLPVAAVSEILICSETSYSLQDFKNKVIADASQYQFTAPDGSPLPSSFDVTSLPKPVNFYIKNIATGCVSALQTVTFVAGSEPTLSATETDYVLCDADFDGKTTFDLDSKKSVFTGAAGATFEYFKDAALTQSIGASYVNETAFNQTVFVKITVPNYCPVTGTIHLKVNIPSASSTLQPKYFICFGDTVRIDAGPENVSWVWSDGQTSQIANFTEPGNYSVKLTNSQGCSYTHDFVISDEKQPKISVINQTNTSIEVIAEGGSQPYRYFFNGVPQSSNILQNPAESSYTIQVESAEGCLGPPKTVYFIKINNAFSPNADGINDVWRVENLSQMQQISIIITDRFGAKVFESTDAGKTEWDGRAGGRALPTASYWYFISWYDPVTQKTEQREGWILLKNRN